MIRLFLKNLGRSLLVMFAAAACFAPLVVLELVFGPWVMLVALAIAIVVYSAICASDEREAERDNDEYLIKLWLTKIEDSVRCCAEADGCKESLKEHCEYMFEQGVKIIHDYRVRFGNTEFAEKAEERLTDTQRNFESI